MQNCQINRPLDIKPVMPILQGFPNGAANAQLLPQPAKDQVRPHPCHRHRFGLAGRVSVNDRQFLAEAQPGAH